MTRGGPTARLRIAVTLSAVTPSSSCSRRRSSGGSVISLSRAREPASSMTSIALSGRWRSEM